MKIKHSKTGKTIKVPKHLESSVRQAISAGTDPMSVMAEGGAVQFPKFGVKMNVPRALYPSNNMNLSMHRNGGLVKYVEGDEIPPITNDQEVMFANNDPYRSLMYNNDPLVSPYPYVGQTAPVASLADLVRPRPALMEGDPNYAPIEELNSMSGSVALKPRSITSGVMNTIQPKRKLLPVRKYVTTPPTNLRPFIKKPDVPLMEGDPNDIPEELLGFQNAPDFSNDKSIVDNTFLDPKLNKPLSFDENVYYRNKLNDMKDDMSYSPYALATNLTQALIQQDRINKTQAPTPFDAVGFTAGVSPNKYDLSAQRQAIDADTAAANMGIRLGGGSYSTQAGNYQKMRNLQMQKKGESFQNESNLNTQAMNEYNKQVAAAANETSKANAAINQANREALYNYNLWKTGAKNAVTADTSKSIANIFNNLTAYQNQKEAWKAYANRLEGKGIQRDTEAGVKGTEKAKYGGMIKSSPKRTLKKKAGK